MGGAHNFRERRGVAHLLGERGITEHARIGVEQLGHGDGSPIEHAYGTMQNVEGCTEAGISGVIVDGCDAGTTDRQVQQPVFRGVDVATHPVVGVDEALGLLDV